MALGKATVPLIYCSLSLLAIAQSQLDQCCITPRLMEGPFYTSFDPSTQTSIPRRPTICQRGTASSGLAPRLIVTGQILDQVCQTPVAGADVDVWQADINGEYSMFEQNSLDVWECRGIVTTNATGHYAFDTVRPKYYGRRPPHIHIKVRAAGYQPLTTQLYFPNEPLNNNWDSSNNPCTHIITNPQGVGFRDFVLTRNGLGGSSSAGSGWGRGRWGNRGSSHRRFRGNGRHW